MQCSQIIIGFTGASAALMEGENEETGRWRGSLVPLGAMVALLAGAKADDGTLLSGKDLIVACNAVMTLSALRNVHDTSSAAVRAIHSHAFDSLLEAWNGSWHAMLLSRIFHRARKCTLHQQPCAHVSLDILLFAVAVQVSSVARFELRHVPFLLRVRVLPIVQP